jgi:hypothetical protein
MPLSQFSSLQPELDFGLCCFRGYINVKATKISTWMRYETIIRMNSMWTYTT